MEFLKNKKRLFVIIGAIVLATVLAVILILVLSNRRTIRLVTLEGTCTVERDGKTLEGSVNMKLKSGDKVFLGGNSFACIRLDKDKFVYLQNEARIQITAEGTVKESKTIVFIEKGTVTTDVQKKLSAKSSYRIVTPNAITTIHGTIVLHGVLQEGDGVRTNVALAEGEAENMFLKTSGSNLTGANVLLKEGEGISVLSEGAEVSMEDFGPLYLREVDKELTLQEIITQDDGSFQFDVPQFCNDDVTKTLKSIAASRIEGDPEAWNGGVISNNTSVTAIGEVSIYGIGPGVQDLMNYYVAEEEGFKAVETAVVSDWDITYSWAEDYASCKAVRTDRNDPSVTEDATSVSVTTIEDVSATCDTEGRTVYQATFADQEYGAPTTTVVRPATGHTWGAPTYNWADDGSEVTATRVCANDPAHIEEETVTTTSEVTREATSDEMGETTYTAVFKNPAFSEQTKILADIEKTTVNWGKITVTWAKDHSSVTAERVSKDDPSVKETEKVDVVTKTKETPATCEKDGEIVYSAKFTNKAFGTQTDKVVLKATGHEWGEPTYQWSSDNTKVTAKCVCKHDASHTLTEEAKVTSGVTKEPTLTAMGETTYTATFTNKEFSKQSKTLTDVAKKDPTWGEVAVIWAEDHSSARATRVCNEDSSITETETTNNITKTKEVPATCEKNGEIVYSAVFSNSAFGTQTLAVVVKAIGHKWGDPTYQWAPDNSKVTAKCVCEHDASHTLTEEAAVTASVSKEATVTEMGETTYTATFTNKAFAAQSKKLTDIPKKDQTWGKVTVTWSSDHSSATATRVCNENSSITETETTNNITKTKDVPATCEKNGEIVYSAAFTNSAFGTQTLAVVLKATGHNMTVDASQSCDPKQIFDSNGEYCIGWSTGKTVKVCSNQGCSKTETTVIKVPVFVTGEADDYLSVSGTTITFDFASMCKKLSTEDHPMTLEEYFGDRYTTLTIGDLVGNLYGIAHGYELDKKNPGWYLPDYCEEILDSDDESTVKAKEAKYEFVMQNAFYVLGTVKGKDASALKTKISEHPSGTTTLSLTFTPYDEGLSSGETPLADIYETVNFTLTITWP